jgi:inositol polyphosphate 5-phosphatase INPP5B/F
MVTVVIERSSKDEFASEDETPDLGLGIPRSTRSDGVAHFGHLRFDRRKYHQITVANTGQVPATIGFIDRPVSVLGEEGPTPPWLTVSFDVPADKPNKSKDTDEDEVSIKGPTYTLEPGETCTIEMAAHVSSPELARNLNDKVTTLDEILILRVKGGRDHFVPVQGKWVKSSISSSRKSEESDRSVASPIDRLRGVAEDGIRKLQNQKPSGTPRGLFSAFGRGSDAS